LISIYFFYNYFSKEIEFPIIRLQNQTYSYGIHYSQMQNSYVLTGLVKKIKFNENEIVLTIATNEDEFKLPWGGNKITYPMSKLTLVQKTQDQIEHQWRGDHNNDLLRNLLVSGMPISLIVDYQLESKIITKVNRVIIHSYTQN